MTKIKIAQIGVSHDHAQDIFDSLLAQDDIFEVIGFVVCEGEEEFFSHLPLSTIYNRSKRMELEEVLNLTDLQAVTIECMEQDLTKYAHMAAKKGLHIHMDKPGSEITGEYEKMLCCCKDNSIVFHVGYMYRYNPAIQKAMEYVKSGKLGKIYSVEAQMSCLLTAEKRKWLEAFQGGMLFYLGCHLVDIILSIQGLPDEIIALNSISGFDDVKALDVGMAAFKYVNGVSFARSIATEAGGGLRRQLVVLGEKGTIEIRPIERWLRNASDRNNIVTKFRIIEKDEAMKGGGMYPPEIVEIGPFNRYDNMMKAFAEMVQGLRKNSYSYEYEAQLHKILMRACGVDKNNKEIF